MEDEEIIALYFARNTEAIKYTSDKYAGRLKALAERPLGSKEDAEECVNDTLFNAWNSIPPNKPDFLSAYLSKICRNLALNRIDWNTAKKRNAVVVELTEKMEKCIPDSNSEENRTEEIKFILNAFLRELSREKRNMFIRRYYFADSYKELAERFGCSESKARVVLFRIKNELKKFLKEEGIDV